MLISHSHQERVRILTKFSYFVGSIRFLSGQKKKWRSNPYRDSFIYTQLLQQFSGRSKILREIHAQIITSGYQHNHFLAAKLVSKYSESSIEDARKVFDSVSERDVLLWNVIIQGYANLGPFLEAIKIYGRMRSGGGSGGGGRGRGVSANKYTYPFVLKACGAMRDVKNGQIIHGHVIISGLESDLFVGNALVAFYSKCSEILVARRVFDEITRKDLVSWNSMIAGYAQNDCANEAIITLHQMLKEASGFVPDRATFVGVLPACAHAAAIQEGLYIHSFIIKHEMELDVSLGSGLISMYGNCGRLGTARVIFDRLQDKNIVVWNSMIRCYGMHGQPKEALEMFSEMVETGINPDSISLLCVLSACSHAGLIDKGWELFEQMEEDYGVEKNDQHYACMVDLLGRAGQLHEAVEFIKRMPVKAGKDVYGALLGACRIHNDINLAEEVAERLFVLDPDNAGRYVFLAKMYEDAGRWKDAARVRKLMREKQVKKQLGCSSIEVDSVFHTFGVEDETHHMSEQIFHTLGQLDSTTMDEPMKLSLV